MLILDMQKIDGAYVYRMGHVIHNLSQINEGDAYNDKLMFLLIFAKFGIEGFLWKSVFPFKTCLQSGRNLLASVSEILDKKPETITSSQAFALKNALEQFEHVLNAEFGQMDIYLVQQKRGFDTNILINSGITIFPPELANKVPDAVGDINSAARCIAFVLPTAAAFHLHRANESVLHVYYDHVTGFQPRPAGRNMGDYLKKLEDGDFGEKRVRSALRDLKDLHRNPLVHPEHSLGTIDEAIALLGDIQSVMVHMLAAIPNSLVLTSP